MKFDKTKIDYSLYFCTDRELMSCDTIEESVEQAILGGTSLVQLREKSCSSREFLQLANRVKIITDKYKVPLIINDRFDIAMLCGAAGVHLGQSDLPCDEVRKIAGDDFIIGVSVANAEEAVRAQQDGADNLGVGAMFTTATKTDTRPVSFEELAKICNSVNIPMVVIGGINKDTIPMFSKTKIDGFAVVSAICAQKDIKQSASELRKMINEII